MKIEAKVEHAVQVREYGTGKWEVFREFDTVEEAQDYAGHTERVVSRTKVTLTDDWQEVTP